jgi:hypothetical protein
MIVKFAGQGQKQSQQQQGNGQQQNQNQSQGDRQGGYQKSGGISYFHDLSPNGPQVEIFKMNIFSFLDHMEPFMINSEYYDNIRGDYFHGVSDYDHYRRLRRDGIPPDSKSADLSPYYPLSDLDIIQTAEIGEMIDLNAYHSGIPECCYKVSFQENKRIRLFAAVDYNSNINQDQVNRFGSRIQHLVNNLICSHYQVEFYVYFFAKHLDRRAYEYIELETNLNYISPNHLRWMLTQTSFFRCPMFEFSKRHSFNPRLTQSIPITSVQKFFQSYFQPDDIVINNLHDEKSLLRAEQHLIGEKYHG